jgi:hypothetical protein
MKQNTSKSAFRRQSNKNNSSNKKLVADGGRAVEVRASGALQRLNEHAAGVDIGGERHYVAVPPRARCRRRSILRVGCV